MERQAIDAMWRDPPFIKCQVFCGGFSVGLRIVILYRLQMAFQERNDFIVRNILSYPNKTLRYSSTILSRPSSDSACSRADLRKRGWSSKTSVPASASAGISGGSNFHGLPPYGTTQPASPSTISASEPVSKPITGSPHDNASMTELGHGGFTSAENKRCEDRINHGICSRGTASMNRMRKALCVFSLFFARACTRPTITSSILNFFDNVLARYAALNNPESKPPARLPSTT